MTCYKRSAGPRIKTLFLEKEYDQIYNFFKENPGQGVFDCCVEVQYDAGWVRQRIRDLIDRGKMKLVDGCSLSKPKYEVVF